MIAHGQVSIGKGRFHLHRHFICPGLAGNITNDEQAIHTIQGAAKPAGTLINSASVFLTNDFNEIFNIQGANTVGAGVCFAYPKPYCKGSWFLKRVPILQSAHKYQG